MKANLTDITFVLDRSASMRVVAKETEEGVANIIEEQKKLPGECVASLVLFDDQVERPFTALPLSEVPPIRCEPRGNTALLDAIWTAITATGNRLLSAPEKQRPSTVLMVISTDGEENSSTHRMDEISKMIAHQRDVYKWQFVFLGANQDAIANASKINIPAQAAILYNASSIGTKAVYGAVNKAIHNVRVGSSSLMAFDDEDRKASVDQD